MKTIVASSIVFGLALISCNGESTVTVTAPKIAVEPITSTQMPPRTDRLGIAIETYEKDPTELNKAAVTKEFAKLDLELADLRERAEKTTGAASEEATLKAKHLQEYRDAESLRLAAVETSLAPAVAERVDTRVDARTTGEKVEDSAKDAGVAIKDAAHETGHVIKEAAKETGHAINHAARKTGDAIKDAVGK